MVIPGDHSALNLQSASVWAKDAFLGALRRRLILEQFRFHPAEGSGIYMNGSQFITM